MISRRPTRRRNPRNSVGAKAWWIFNGPRAKTDRREPAGAEQGQQIAGMLGCWDRMLIFGTLPGICFAGGMTSFLYERGIRIFDYPKFAEPFRNRIRENAEKLAAEAGIIATVKALLRLHEAERSLAHANDQLQIVNKELQRSNRDLQYFAFAASHDLQEPLRTISAFVGLIRHEVDEGVRESQKSNFDRVFMATNRMQ